MTKSGSDSQGPLVNRAILASIRQQLEDASKPMLAKELLRRVRKEVDAALSTTDVNRVLYAEGSAQFTRDDEYRWRLNVSSPTPSKTAPPADKQRRAKTKPATPSPSSTRGSGANTEYNPDRTFISCWPALRTDASGGPPTNWTKTQRTLIGFPSDRRVLVTAGPGTGKTAVACAKVASLLDQRLSPASILMFSFTRTAVAEVRNRISALAASGAEAAGAVRITTLDSHVWHLNKGFGDQASDQLFTSFEESISRARTLFETLPPEAREFLSKLKHVIVDEAQDLVEERANLVLAFLKALNPECGFTVFADPAQALYDFAKDDTETATSAPEFSERLRSEFSGIEECQLNELHRTDNASLVALFKAARAALSGAQRLPLVREALSKNAATVVAELDELQLTPNHLVLYRRRADALQASSYLSKRAATTGKVHRLRLSGFPQPLHPWLGVMFRDLEEKRISKSEFDLRWAERLAGRHDDQDRDYAWGLLQRFVGNRGVVPMAELRSLLSRPRPPVEFCQSDSGCSGPILGTIHASKGRQAQNVVLVVPPERAGTTEAEDAAEARVLYVGATRVRESFSVKTGYRTAFQKDASGRVFGNRDGSSIQVEIGLDGDFENVSPVSADFVENYEAVVALQNLLANGIGHAWATAKLRSDGAKSHYLLTAHHPDGDVLMGGLSSELFHSLRAIARHYGGTFAPFLIPHISIFGVRSVVLAEDAPEFDRANIYDDFRRSGFFLAPLVKALTIMKINKGTS